MDDNISELASKVKKIMDGIKDFDEKDSATALSHGTRLIAKFDNIIESTDTIDKRCWLLKRAKACLGNMDEIFVSGIINNDENKIKFITYYSNLNGLISQMEGDSDG